MSGYKASLIPNEELSFPSYIPPNKTYTPTTQSLPQGGISVVDGIVVLATILREINV